MEASRLSRPRGTWQAVFQQPARILRLLSAVALVPAAALIAGALLAYPVHLLLNLTGSVPFHKALSVAAVLGGLAASFAYLRLTGRSGAAAAGLVGAETEWRIHLPATAAGAVLLVLLLEFSLVLLDVRALRHDQGITPYTIAHTFVRALLVGFVVAFVEETIFRGALFTALQRQGGGATALFISSAIYAAVHYIKFPPVAETPGWFTGLIFLPAAFRRFSDPAILDALLTLFVLGLLLGLMRLRSGKIIQCIGFHAGLVGALGLADFVTEHRPGAELGVLVSRYDQPLGWMAAAWLAVFVMVYLAVARGRPDAESESAD